MKANDIFDDVTLELQAIIGKALAHKHATPFAVPPNYFELFNNRILERLRSKQTPPFEVPPNYFNDFSKNLLQQVKANNSLSANVHEEMQQLSPLIAGIGNANVFHTPPHYFNTAPKTFVRTRKVLSPKATLYKKWMPYVAAAVILFCIVTIGLVVMNKPTQHTTFASNLTAEQIDANVAALSDDEITAYLASYNEDIESNLIAVSTDLAELPTTDAYLLSDSTLDVYIQNNNLKK